MPTGKPSVPVVKDNDARRLEGAFAAVRERLRVLDSELALAQRQIATMQAGGSTAAQLAVLQAQFNALQIAIGGSILTALQALLGGEDGIVVVSDGDLLSRTLQAGANITITNADGVAGDPIISSTASGGGVSLLGTENGDYIGDENGNRFLVSRS